WALARRPSSWACSVPARVPSACRSGSAQAAPSRRRPSSSAGSAATSYPVSGGTWLVTSCVGGMVTSYGSVREADQGRGGVGADRDHLVVGREPEHLGDQRGLVREVPVDAAGGDTGPSRDRGDRAGRVAVLGEQADRGPQDRVLGGVQARLDSRGSPVGHLRS